MCRIIGYMGNRNATEIIMKALERLEYRGYDSWDIEVISERLIADIIKNIIN
ncbi:MAG: hypothetical protein ABIK61_05405 [candidate division WOR-3 bacterium]